MDFNIPPFEDLLRHEAPEPDNGIDLDALIRACVSGEPVVTKTQANTYASRPGRADASELLTHHFQRFKAPAPTSAPDNSDIAKMVADLVAEQMKALSPSTMTRPATEAAPARATSPEAAMWDWETEIIGDGAGVIPRKQTEPASATYAAGARSRSIDDGGDLSKRANIYTSMLLGTPTEQRAAHSAIVTWKAVNRGGTVWKQGYDEDSVLVAEFQTDEEE